MRSVQTAGAASIGLMWGWLGGTVARGARRAVAAAVGVLTGAAWALTTWAVAGSDAVPAYVVGLLGGVALHGCWVRWLHSRL